MNILLKPTLFVDQDSNSPPAAYNATTGKYEILGSSYINWGGNDTPVVLNGDTFAGRFTNRGQANLRIGLSIGSISENFDLAPGASIEKNYIALKDGDIIDFVFMVPNGNIYAIDLLMEPTGASGGGGTDPIDVPEGADTYSAKGFLSFGALVNNANRQVARLGELSVYSQTFARDRVLFSTGSGGSTDTAITTSVFSSRAATGSDVAVPVQYGELMAQLGAWIYTQANDGAFNSDPETFRQAVLAEFGTKVYQLSVGNIIQQGTIFLPDSMTFYINPDTTITTSSPPDYLERSRIKLWLSDAAFRTQYDEYSYEFIAPIDTLDDFFRTREQVEAKVAQRTQQELMLKIQSLADGDPYTVLKSENFDKHEADDLTYRLPTDWTFIIYGAAGDNIDAIKDKLIDWILDNSTHTREEWAVIFPDIFTSTEFILTPFWSDYAIPNKTLEMGMYSPTIPLDHAREVSRLTAIGTKYTQAHTDSVASFVATTYKSLMMSAVGGPENRDGVKKFYDQFKDYIAVSTTSIDFDRMDPITQGWVAVLYELLKVAEEMTEFSDIPTGMTRLRRVDSQGRQILYVVKNYRNVQYLMVSKLSVSRYFQPVDVEPLILTFEGVEGITVMRNGIVTDPYLGAFEAFGGVAPMTYSLPVGLPDKVSNQHIDPVTGQYSATFDARGQTRITVAVTDSTGLKVTVEFDLYIEDRPQT